MSKIAIDSSVVIKWFVSEPFSTEAQKVLSSYQTGTLTLLAPDLLCAEIGNIVWKKCLYQGLDAADAQEIIEAFSALDFELTPASELLKDAYSLAIAHGRTVYDSLYLALSIRERCPFVTADERLVNAVQAKLPNVVWVKNWK